ncbi:DUF3857 and transglutaminase domain-containing protein [Aurantibacter crassamenti]|uniref:DUF3857 domain-containing protein n=1 Tax=Aurantibacter crassamenti TaxID=1837375 RepID=UPI0019397333|nr:DUF3857 domain-containing protein [Aurantibacter crassamenti]MBM1106207.1 DUF3857 and transglutaminase domain-containing protein [Aurantibacter crassamenti]
MTKRLLAIIILYSCVNFNITSQMPNTFGQLTDKEKHLTTYDKDLDANAIFLYERGDNYFKVVDNSIRLIKEYHVKIKILDEEGFDWGTVEIPLYHHGSSREKVSKIKAVTHNDNKQFNLLPSEIFTEEQSDRWIIKKFTFPKLQVGSILEYSYTIETPYAYNFEGWKFQASIPKIYSEFNAKIPGNWNYNRALIGKLKLDTNDSQIKKDCFHIDGLAKSADCEVLKYSMVDIPAFKEEKGFMLASKNYQSRIDFELSEYNRFDGTSDKFTKTWKDVDYEFRSDKDIGRQLTKKGFFERNVPEELLTEGTDLEKANNIYKFIQQHYNWNGKYSTYGKARVKNAFENRKGNAWEINMSLINLLNSADIPAKLMLISTRELGLPKKVHPVMSDFNYILAHVKIDENIYLLDATEKSTPFGMLPFRALNLYGRVMDFKNESYWSNIIPEQKNTIQIRCQITFNSKTLKPEGVLDFNNTGYFAVNKWESINAASNEDYLDGIKNSAINGFTILDYNLATDKSNDKKVSERIKFEIENPLKGDKVYFNPFLISFFKSNPFKLETRDYPIDFGYPKSYKYQIIIKPPSGYKIGQIPKSALIKFDDSIIELKYLSSQNEKQLIIKFQLNLTGTQFAPEDYNAIKQLFSKAVEFQNKSIVVFEKE